MRSRIEPSHGLPRWLGWTNEPSLKLRLKLSCTLVCQMSRTEKPPVEWPFSDVMGQNAVEPCSLTVISVQRVEQEGWNRGTESLQVA